MQESAESFVLRGSMSMFAVPASAAINVVYGMDLLIYDCLYNLFELDHDFANYGDVNPI
jgi:hypothetical protein